jgi:hypothetical protein
MTFSALVRRGNRRAAREAGRIFLLATLAIGALGCATIGSGVASVPLRVEVNVVDATVWIDDHLAGSAMALSKPGTRLRVGFHRVEIRHPAYYSFFTEIKPAVGDDVVVRAQLHELVQ